MFDARMHVESIRLFVSMYTVWRHTLISLKMVNEVDVLVDLSENVTEDKSTPKRKGQRDGLTKRRTFLSICLRKAPVYGTYLAKTIT